MAEETSFWGVPSLRRWDETRPLSWRGTAPGTRPFRFYPVFSSRQRAEEFVREHGQRLMLDRPQLEEELIGGIHKIKRAEIREQDYVLSERKGLVTWAKLLNEGG